MPPKRSARKKYPDYCYETVTWVERGVTRTQRFAIPEKIKEYDREHDIETIQTITQKQNELQKKVTEAKKKPPPKKRGRKSRKQQEEEEISELHEELEELLGDKLTNNEIIDEDQLRLERMQQNYQQLKSGNNSNLSEEEKRIAENQLQSDIIRTQNENIISIDDDDDDDEGGIPFGDSIYKPRQPKKKNRKDITEQKKKERRSNYLVTVATNVDLDRYTKDEVEIIARELQERLKGALYYYAPDYIRVLEENNDMDLIENVKITIKTEMQESRGKHGQLHSHSIVAITHYTKVQLDYGLIHELISEIARDFGFKKKDGSGIAKFQVQIQRASDSAQNEYDYLAEDGVTYEAGDVGEYYEQAEAAIKEGSMERSELRSFRRRKKEVASAQKTVRELRGQKFGF